MRPRHRVARRKPVFLGCEGESEQAYGQMLYDIVRKTVITIHLEVSLLGSGAGSPSAKIRKAIEKIEDYERKRSRFWKQVVLIDSDLIDGNDAQRIEAENLAAECEIRVIWQRPCHEAFLLRHLPGCAQHRPPTSALSQANLIDEWPEYKKPMTRLQLVRRINENSVRQAASVENEFRSFLAVIGRR